MAQRNVKARMLERFGLDPEDTIDCADTYREDALACESDMRCQWSAKDSTCEWTMDRKIRVMVRMCKSVAEMPDRVRRSSLQDLDRSLGMSDELKSKLDEIPPDDEEQWRVACYEIMRSLILPALEIEPGTLEAEQILELVDRAERQLMIETGKNTGIVRSLGLKVSGHREPSALKRLYRDWRAVPKWPKLLSLTAGAVGLVFAHMVLAPAILFGLASGLGAPNIHVGLMGKLAPMLIGYFLTNILGLTVAYQSGGVGYLAASKIGGWFKSFFQ